ncbi:MAG: helix-hairpin-helix domain-containing protein [Bacillota bacterium]
MEFSPAARFAAFALLVLFLVGLAWGSVKAYHADRRAQLAALASEAPSPALSSDGGEALPASVTVPAPVPPPPKQQIQVHVEGAVQRPGVYTLEEGARVHEAIAAAGGALPEGVPGALNLAARVTDGAKIYVHTRAELQPAAQPPPEAREATYKPVKASEPPSTVEAQRLVVNLNTATAAELERVPGIGPATARAIVQHRTKHGPFRRVEDLTAVSGIGPKTLKRLRPYLTV